MYSPVCLQTIRKIMSTILSNSTFSAKTCQEKDTSKETTRTLLAGKYVSPLMLQNLIFDQKNGKLSM